MSQRLKSCLASLACGLFLVACASTPPTPEVPPAEFQNIIGQARASENIVRVNRELTAFLAREGVSATQAAEVHLLRGFKRWHGSFDLPGAAADFERFLALAPEDARGEETRRQLAEIFTEVSVHEQALAGLQTLENWFDDKVALGQLDEAVSRQRRAGIAPNERQTELLREAGYICVAGTDGASRLPVHQHGDVVEAHAAGLVWCTQTPKA